MITLPADYATGCPDSIIIKSAVFCGQGFFITPCGCDDFWLPLNDIMGWGHFGRYSATDERITLLEVAPKCGPRPAPLYILSNVLWRKREALEAVLEERISAEEAVRTFLLYSQGSGRSRHGNGL